MPSSNPVSAMLRHRGFADLLLGALGAAVIRGVLTLARLWARVTRSSWHG
jgi:hypothetical protein